jgi:uncharacterized protein YdhG (YjbR/CyaY superfamily)
MPTSKSNRQKTAPAITSIDAYIADFPPAVQKRLQQVRKTIAKAARGAEEAISYRIPAFKLNGYLIYFAGFKNHIGLYPARIKELEKELAAYKGGKGTVQFPHDTPLPLDLITRIVKFRIADNELRAAAKKAKAKAATSKRTVTKPQPKAAAKVATKLPAKAKRKK